MEKINNITLKEWASAKVHLLREVPLQKVCKCLDIEPTLWEETDEKWLNFYNKNVDTDEQLEKDYYSCWSNPFTGKFESLTKNDWWKGVVALDKINGVSFENWVCANGLLEQGLNPQKIFDSLKLDKPTWIKTDKAWDNVYATDETHQLMLKRASLEDNLMSHKFSHITQAEIDTDLEENGGFRYFIEADLPNEGLTLAFLKEQDEDEWVDFVYSNLENKLAVFEDVEEGVQSLNSEEYLFYSVMCLEMDMSWGFNDYFASRPELSKEIESHLERIGAKKYLALVKKAKPIYQQYQVLQEDDEELAEDAPSKNNDLLYELEEKLSELDDKYYRAEEKKSLKDFLLKYVKKNVGKFVEK